MDDGCGRGKDVEFYRELGCDAEGYDPYVPYRWSETHSGQYPIVTMIYVTDVIPTEEHRLLVEKALAQDRVRLLIADDVSPGKTLEAGLITSELALRGRADRILAVTTIHAAIIEWYIDILLFEALA